MQRLKWLKAKVLASQICIWAAGVLAHYGVRYFTSFFFLLRLSRGYECIGNVCKRKHHPTFCLVRAPEEEEASGSYREWHLLKALNEELLPCYDSDTKMEGMIHISGSFTLYNNFPANDI